MTIRKTTSDALQFEALLIARMFGYEMFYHLLGGAPTAELLDVLSSAEAQEILDEYEDVEAIAALRQQLAAYTEMLPDEQQAFVEAAKDEYTRVFVGPASLPASPYESPYVGSHDTALLQENTLAVRRIYRDYGLEPKRLQAVPDDHIAFMCAFMVRRSQCALGCFDEDRPESLGSELLAQSNFLGSHVLNWVDIFAESVVTSKAASGDVLYPTVLRALAAFAESDRAFALLGFEWLEEALADGVDFVPCSDETLAQTEHSFVIAKNVCETLRRVKQLGLADYCLVQV